VDVVDGTVQRGDGGDRVGAHPQQVAGVEVGADGIPDSLPESEQVWHVVDELVGVHLDGEANSASFGLRGQFTPVVERDALLMFQELEVLRRPHRGDPGREPVSGGRGKPGHGDDSVDLEFLGELQRATEVLIVAVAADRVQRVAGRIERLSRRPRDVMSRRSVVRAAESLSSSIRSACGAGDQPP